MELTKFFRSVLEQDTSAVVICDLDHRIVYMNPAAIKRYDNRGGGDLVGKNLFSCHNRESQEKMKQVIAWFLESRDHNRIYTSRNDKENKDVYMIALRDEDGVLIGYYEKHEYRDREQGKLYNFQ